MIEPSNVFLVDDDAAIRKALSRALTTRGYVVQTFESAIAFLDQHDADIPGCLIVDLRMPGMSGLELQDKLKASGSLLPIIFMTGHGEVPDSVRAVKAGAVDFLQKPFQQDVLIDRLDEAFQILRERLKALSEARAAEQRFHRLTERETEVLGLLIAGQPNCTNKDIADTLKISVRTVENHRAQIMEKTEAKNLAELLNLAAMAEWQHSYTLPE